MKRKNQIVGAAILAFGLFLLWQASQLRYLTPLGPGPGFFGVWLGIIESLLGLSLLITASLGRDAALPEGFWPAPQGWARMAVIVAGFAFTALFLETLGYRITAFVLLLVLTVSMGNRNPLLALAMALLGSFGVFYLFNDLLQTHLPVGVFGL